LCEVFWTTSSYGSSVIAQDKNNVVPLKELIMATYVGVPPDFLVFGKLVVSGTAHWRVVVDILFLKSSGSAAFLLRVRTPVLYHFSLAGA
jgi:hypothetical protein